MAAMVLELRIADNGKDFGSRPVDRFQLVFGGLEGDLHAGATRGADARTPWHKRGTPIANTRQVSIVSVEESALIARALDLAALDPGLLGANLVVEGIPGLTQLAPATRLQFPSGATIFVTESNPPCRQPGRKLADAHGRKDLEMAFVKQAAGLRGLVGLVEREGEVRAGDAIRIIAPRG
jgi:MOSC domain-containing protein YiiM